MSKHAEIFIGEYTIPLIGIKPSSVEEECDLCHDILQFQSIELVGKQFLCPKCRKVDHFR